MRQTLLTAFLALIAVSVTTPANAAESVYRWYVGGAIARADLDAGLGNADLGGTIINLDIDDDSTGWRLFGGYRFNRYLGVEGSYIDFDDFGTSVNALGLSAGASAEAHGTTLALTGAIPLGRRFAITGRAGYLFWDAELDVDLDGDRLESANEDGSDPFIGAGLQYLITDRFAVRGIWDHYELDDVDLDFYGIEGEFRF